MRTELWFWCTSRKSSWAPPRRSYSRPSGRWSGSPRSRPPPWSCWAGAFVPAAGLGPRWSWQPRGWRPPRAEAGRARGLCGPRGPWGALGGRGNCYRRGFSRGRLSFREAEESRGKLATPFLRRRP